MGSFINIRVYDTRFFWLGGLKLKVTPQATEARCSLLATPYSDTDIGVPYAHIDHCRAEAIGESSQCWKILLGLE